MIYYQTEGYLRDDVQIIAPAQVASILWRKSALHRLPSPCSPLIGMWLRAVNPRWDMKAKRILFSQDLGKKETCVRVWF